MTTTNISQLKFNKLSEAQYEGTTPVDGEFYITPCPTYALDSEAVHKSGDEEISGVKTFSDEVVFNAIPVINGGKNDSTEGGEIHIACAPSGGWDRDTTIIDEVADGIRFFNFKNNQVYGYRFDLNEGYGLPSVRMVVNTWKSGTSWYRVWSDGWIEQGSYSTNKTNTQTITFYKAFTNIPTLQTTIVTTRGGASYDGEIFPRSISNTNFVFGSRLNDCSGWSWYACGY